MYHMYHMYEMLALALDPEAGPLGSTTSSWHYTVDERVPREELWHTRDGIGTLKAATTIAGLFEGKCGERRLRRGAQAGLYVPESDVVVGGLHTQAALQACCPWRGPS